jgi:membrane carboxypeptidase/penicillin-binding protein
MASAYAVIANQGRRAEPYAIIRIVNRQGRTVFRQYPSVRRVVDAQTAYLVTDLMQSVFEPGGTGYRVSDDVHRPTAAKTGTTNSDAWMIGFTPDLATAVWIGYDKGKPITTSDARQASPIFAKFMDAALRDVPPNPFPVPRDIVFVKIDPATGKRATSACTDSRTEPFVKGTEPTKWCPLHPILKSTNPPMQTQSPNDTNWWHDLQRWWLSP